MRRTLLALAALLALTGPAVAAMPIGQNFGPTETGVSAALLSGSPCMTLRVGGFNTVAVYVNLTRAAATTLTAACTAGPTSSLLSPLPAATVTTKVSLTQLSPTFSYDTVSASGLYRFLIAPLADDTLKCCFSGASASTDTISVYARGVGQQ